MDGSAFDHLTRTLTAAGSRRHALGGLLAGPLGLLGSTAEHAAAKKKPCSPCKKRKKGKCKKKLPDGTACAGGTCQGGSCVASPSCPAGQRPCRGSCLSTLICCDDRDCAGGRTCQNGTCACPADKPHICPGSICRECCELEDCQPQISGFDGLVCQNGQCLCTRDGTRRCASGRWQGWCGHCCDDSECSGLICGTHSDSDVPHCGCSGVMCNDICVPSDCAGKCQMNCTTMPVGTSCCGNGALKCHQVTPSVRWCLPPA